jgi:hypothetical protein
MTRAVIQKGCETVIVTTGARSSYIEEVVLVAARVAARLIHSGISVSCL